MGALRVHPGDDRLPAGHVQLREEKGGGLGEDRVISVRLLCMTYDGVLTAAVAGVTAGGVLAALSADILRWGIEEEGGQLCSFMIVFALIQPWTGDLNERATSRVARDSICAQRRVASLVDQHSQRISYFGLICKRLVI